MSWTENKDSTKILYGPYRIGKGAAGSEAELGETSELVVSIRYTVNEIGCGNLFGKETLKDAVVAGVRVEGTFNLFQTDTTNMNRVMPGSSLSAGASNKELKLDADSCCGIALSGSATRYIFHYAGATAFTDLEKDIEFKNAVVIPDGEMDLTGENARTLPCRIIGFIDSSNELAQFSENET